jgi:hypothetical protein
MRISQPQSQKENAKVFFILHHGSQNSDICLGACLHSRMSRASAQAYVSFDLAVVRTVMQSASQSPLILEAHSEKQGQIIKYTTDSQYFHCSLKEIISNLALYYAKAIKTMKSFNYHNANWNINTP